MSKPRAIAPSFLTLTHRANLTSQLSVEFDWDAGIHSVLEHAAIEAKLDDAAVVIADLSMLPLKTGTEGWSIFALCGPRQAGDLLISHHSARAVESPLSLTSDACIAVSTEKQARQLKALVPDISVRIVAENSAEMLALVTEGMFSGALIPSVSYAQDLGADIPVVVKSLHPKELVPPAGRGVVALVGRTDDAATRQLLKSFHQPEIALCTNIERTFYTSMAASERPELSAYCMTDQRGYYHLHVHHCGLQVKKSLSYSTSFGLGETLAAEFTKQLSQHVSDL